MLFNKYSRLITRQFDLTLFLHAFFFICTVYAISLFNTGFRKKMYTETGICCFKYFFLPIDIQSSSCMHYVKNENITYTVLYIGICINANKYKM